MIQSKIDNNIEEHYKVVQDAVDGKGAEPT